MAIFPSTAIPSGASDFDIPYSCRFDAARTTKLSKDFGSAGNRKTMTFSFWVKRHKLGTDGDFFIGDVQASYPGHFIKFNQDDQLDARSQTGIGGDTLRFETTRRFRDVSAWYHIMVVVDTTQADAANRMKMYVNGVRETVFDVSTSTYAQDADTYFNHGDIPEYIGVYSTIYSNYSLAEYHFIDGTALTPSSFGETGDYGEWKPIEVTGVTYGTNGFYLDFADAADLGDDESGNGKDWTETNLAATDQMLDTPTNNFATLNPIMGSVDAHPLTYFEGNLKIWSSGWNGAMSTIPMSSGKWYCEYISNGTSVYAGVASVDQNLTASNPHGWSKALQYGKAGDGHLIQNDAVAVSGYGATWSAGDIIGIALDKDDDTLTFYKNNVAQPEIDLTSYNVGTDELLFSFSQDGLYLWVNFGQDSSFAGEKTAQGNGGAGEDFYYTPPTGFKALCTSNLPAVAVTPSEHFNTLLYTGNGSTQDITTVGFQPDLTWIKNRDTNDVHQMFDAVRGVTKAIEANDSDLEVTNDDTLTHFLSGGFTTGDDDITNTNTENYVAWNWKANGAGSANTAGNMAETVTVSANTDAGFSIVTYTGDGSAGTVGHGLSKAPEMIWVKNRSDNDNWRVFHHGIATDPETDWLEFNNNAAAADNADNWNDTAPTSTVFTVNTNVSVNEDNKLYVAYCFHSVDGYSKVGSYTGNGNADGAFVYTGFRPIWVLIKNTAAIGSWYLYDSVREPYNVVGHPLHPNLNSAEGGGADRLDILSNGFKLRHTDSDLNDTETYIYLAFAETPFKYSNAR